MSLLVITNELLIEEGNLGCRQPNSLAASTQQDWIIAVPTQFIEAVTEQTGSIDCSNIMVTLLCLWSWLSKIESFQFGLQRIVSHNVCLFSMSSCWNIYMNIGKNSRFQNFLETRKVGVSIWGKKATRYPRRNKTGVGSRCSPQHCSVCLCSCDRTHYKHLPFPRGMGKQNLPTFKYKVA